MNTFKLQRFVRNVQTNPKDDVANVGLLNDITFDPFLIWLNSPFKFKKF